MGSQSTRIPIIDFSESDLKQGSPKWNSIKSQVIEAAVEYGCFEAVFPSVTEQHFNQVYDQVKELFELPQETKQRLPQAQHLPGYVEYLTLPLYQSMGFTNAQVMENLESLAATVWPQGNTKFCENLQCYTEKLIALDRMVRPMIAESFGLEKHLKEQNEFLFYATRPARYDAPKSGKREIGLGSHIDTGYLAILSQNQVNGLHVETKDGRWIDVNPSPHNFIVLIGEPLGVWTNGRLHPANHRVMMTPGVTRYSIGFFVYPNVGYKCMTPKELIDEDHPACYEPYEILETMRRKFNKG